MKVKLLYFFGWGKNEKKIKRRSLVENRDEF